MQTAAPAEIEGKTSVSDSWIDYPQHPWAWFWVALLQVVILVMLSVVSAHPRFSSGARMDQAWMRAVPLDVETEPSDPDISADPTLHPAQRVQLPHVWDDETTHATNRMVYTLPWPQKLNEASAGTASLASESDLHLDQDEGWSLLISRIGARYRIRLDGHIIHSAYWRTPGYVDTSAEPQMIHLPSGLDMNAPHSLEIEIQGLPLRKSGLEVVYLARSHEILKRYNQIYWWQIYLTWMICACSGMLCLMTGLIWWVGRESIFAWLSLSSLAWMIRLGLTPQVTHVFDFEWWFFIHKVSFAVYCGCLYLFMWELFQLKQKKMRQTVWTLLGLSPVWIGFILWTGNYDAYRLLTALFVIISVTSLGMMLFRAKWGINANQRLMVVVGLGTMITGMRDFLSVQFGILGDADMRWMTPGSLVFLLTLNLILVQRMSRYVEKIRGFNVNLQIKLEQKEEELTQAFERIRDVEKQQVLIRERARLTRDMHDGLGSQLVQTLNAVRSGKSPSPQEIEHMLGHVLEELRMTLDSMEPMEGDLPTILGTLRQRIAPALDAAGIELEWLVDEVPTLLDPQGRPLETQSVMHIFRCVQEVFANAIKHAQATRIELQTGFNSTEVWLSITDNGQGMQRESRDGGRGLDNIRVRAHSIGAQVSWNNRPGTETGTQVLFSFPRHPKPETPSPASTTQTTAS